MSREVYRRRNGTTLLGLGLGAPPSKPCDPVGVGTCDTFRQWPSDPQTRHPAESRPPIRNRSARHCRRDRLPAALRRA
jgi:hypothetical protein